MTRDMTTEYVSRPGEVQLRPGDVVQLDGGLCIVDLVNDCRARCVPIGKKRVEIKSGDKTVVVDKRDRTYKSICNCLPKHLVIERRGQEGLEQFMNEGKDKNMLTLELGDRLCYGAKLVTVVRVYDTKAVIGDLEGNEVVVPRRMNEIYFTDCCTDKMTRLDAQQREANLIQFLAQRKPPLPEEQQNSGDKGNDGMATRTKGKKGGKGKKAAATTGAAETNGKATAKLMDLKPASTIKELRNKTGSKAKAVELLTKGATIEQLTKETDWTTANVRARLRALNVDSGYGVKESEDGVFTLVTK